MSAREPPPGAEFALSWPTPKFCPECGARVESAERLGSPGGNARRFGLNPCRHNVVLSWNLPPPVVVMRDPYFDHEQQP